METLKRQVHRARQRVIFQQFLKVLAWSLFTTLIVAALGLAVLKIWPLGVDRVIWTSSWVGGAVGLGLLVAFVWTYAIRRGALDVAIEIDRRYGLKERVSSSLSLDEEELESEAGQALVKDAMRRIERIDVTERFGMSAGKRALLPLLPALVVFVLAVTDVRQDQKTEAATTSAAAKKQVKKSNQQLKKKMAKHAKKANELGLPKDTQKLFNKLEDGIDKMSNKDDVDKKKAMVKLNDLAKQLKKRRQLLGGSDQIKNRLNQLKNMKQGPADKMVKALKDGNFQKALDEIKNLQEQLKQGNLTEQQKAQLAEQMQQMQQKMQQIADAHEQAKQELEEQIKQKLKAGDRASAGKLQQKLDRLNQQNQQMSRLRKMGQVLGQTSQSLAKGNPQEAMKQLDQLSDELQDMQRQLDEMEMLDEALDQFGQTRDAMNCKNCQGAGCAMCMGDSFGMNQGNPGFGMGEGQGRGDRPEERDQTKSYNSRVRAKPDPKGKAVITDMIYGPNATGDAREQIKSEIATARTSPADPLTNQRLPRRQREQAKQYFDAFRSGRN